MKDPKNTRDYGKFDGPRRLFARGGRVKREPGLTDHLGDWMNAPSEQGAPHGRYPSLTEHLQTGPSWWPEPLGSWRNKQAAPPDNAPAPRTDHRALDKMLKFAEKMARMNKESDGGGKGSSGGGGRGAAPTGDAGPNTPSQPTSYPNPPGDNISSGDAGGSGGGGVASDSSTLISQQPDDI